MIADGTVEAFRLQAHFCGEFDSPLYAELLARAADDIEVGGPFAALLDGWQGRPMPDALPLRLLGAVHRMVLDGSAAELARFYPSAGGTPHWPETWETLHSLVARRAAELRPALDRQVQTNEIRRSAALLGGFLTITGEVDLPLRLLEIGCSAGLNQYWDRYRFELAECAAGSPPASGAAWRRAWGAPSAEVVVRCGWHGDSGVLSGSAVVGSRAGCDIAPIDVTDDEQTRILESFVWPDHVQRLAQLRAAITAARRDPPRLTRSAAADWLALHLAEPAVGTATVVFHSIMWWYLSEEERDRVTALITAAGARHAAGASRLAAPRDPRLTRGRAAPLPLAGRRGTPARARRCPGALGHLGRLNAEGARRAESRPRRSG